MWFFRQRDGHTIQSIADEFGVDTTTVDRGLAWCRSQRIGTRELAHQLEDRIADLREDISRVERQIRSAERRIKVSPLAGPKDSPLVGLTQAVGQLYRELREQKKYLAELEGLYRTTVNVKLGTNDGNELRLTLHTGSDAGD